MFPFQITLIHWTVTEKMLRSTQAEKRRVGRLEFYLFIYFFKIEMLGTFYHISVSETSLKVSDMIHNIIPPIFFKPTLILEPKV